MGLRSGSQTLRGVRIRSHPLSAAPCGGAVEAHLTDGPSLRMTDFTGCSHSLTPSERSEGSATPRVATKRWIDSSASPQNDTCARNGDSRPLELRLRRLPTRQPPLEHFQHLADKH